MKNIVRTGLVVGLVFLSACDGGEKRPSVKDAPPVEAAALQAAVVDADARAFYEHWRWMPVWSGKNEAALKAAIDARAEHGLDRLNPWPDLNGKPAAEREAALTRAALRYAGALARGASDPRKLREIYELKRPETDVTAGLRQAIGDGRLADWLKDLAPRDEAYKALSKAYLQQRDEAAAKTGTAIQPGEALKPGASDSRVPQVRAALADAGYLNDPATEGDVYGPALVDGVKALQANYGITADGVIGADTLAVLNMGPEGRARALAVALERLRWLARDPAPDRIDVNTAAAELSYFRQGKVVNRRKVVSGRPGRETPQMESPIYRLVASPTWTVPRSIEGEITGKGAAHMRRNGIGWKNQRLVQKSGPQNALGLVKFDMRNEHSIYLHDTPAKTLFGRHQRQLSHGCVRVENAEAFAETLAADEGVQAQWADAKAKGEEAYVPLPREIPVRLMYHTAFVTDGGAIRYTTDPYGWDDAIAKALGFTDAARARFRGTVEDTGP